jgi:hypothetical protein
MATEITCINETGKNNFTSLDAAEEFSSTNILKHQINKPGGAIFLSEIPRAKHGNH